MLFTSAFAQQKIVQGEYFWDTDPGQGGGTALLALDGNFNQTLEELFKNGISVSSLSQGAHVFNVRVKCQDNTWSNTFKQTIFIQGPLTAITRTTKIIQAEYFWNTDPGQGSGTALLALDGNFNQALEELFKQVSTSSLPGGPNSFNIRTLGNDGSWSNVFKQTIFIIPTNSCVTTSSITASKTTICAGNLVSFSVTAVNQGVNPTYQWKKNGGNVGTNSSTYTVNTLANNDIITCEVTSSDPCNVNPLAISNSIIMIVNANVTPSLSISSNQGNSICSGASITFTTNPSNGGSSPSYQWKKNGSNVGSGLPSYSPTSLVNGDVISCQLTSNAACASPSTAISNSITMNVTLCTGIEDNITDPTTWEIYPNPTKSIIYIETNKQEIVNAQLTIVNALGQSVLHHNLNNSFIAIDVSALASGIYSLHIHTPQQKFTKKMIIE